MTDFAICHMTLFGFSLRGMTLVNHDLQLWKYWCDFVAKTALSFSFFVASQSYQSLMLKYIITHLLYLTDKAICKIQRFPGTVWGVILTIPCNIMAMIFMHLMMVSTMLSIVQCWFIEKSLVFHCFTYIIGITEGIDMSTFQPSIGI